MQKDRMKGRINIPNNKKSPYGGFRGCFFLLFFSLFSCTNNQPQIPANKLPKDYTKENLLEMNKVLAEKENKDIAAYIENSNQKFTRSPLGFWYFIENPGIGRQIERGNKVHVTYNLKMLDGSVCYTPQHKGNNTIIIGMYDIIKGLDDSLLLLKEGGQGIFIIPSDLAFSTIGDQDCVGSKKTVIYEIKLIEILP